MIHHVRLLVGDSVGLLASLYVGWLVRRRSFVRSGNNLGNTENKMGNCKIIGKGKPLVNGMERIG